MAYNKFIKKDGTVMLSLLEDTVTAETLQQGVTAHNRSGEAVTGTLDPDASLNAYASKLANIVGDSAQTPTDVEQELNYLLETANRATGVIESTLAATVDNLVDGYGRLVVTELPDEGKENVVYKCNSNYYEYFNGFYDVAVSLTGTMQTYREITAAQGIDVNYVSVPTKSAITDPVDTTFYYVEDEEDIYVLFNGELSLLSTATGKDNGGIIEDISNATGLDYYYIIFKTQWVQFLRVEGKLNIAENGEHNVAIYEKVNINVPNGIVVGKRKFVESPTVPSIYITQQVNYTTMENNQLTKYTQMGAGVTGSMNEDRISYGNYVYTNTGGWQEESLKTIDFGATPQVVSNEFAQFIANNTEDIDERIVEVATETEMNVLFPLAENGTVFKYVGETGTYENGALYVVEEETHDTGGM